MRKVEINLTDEQVKFLRLFAVEQHEGAVNNFGTRKPMHIVQTRDDEVLFDDGEYADDSGEDVLYFDTHSQEVIGKDTDVLRHEGVREKDIISCADAQCEKINGVEIYDIVDYFNAFGISPDKYMAVSKRERWENRAYFFILSEAKKYMKYQAHNLCTPRTYTVSSGYSNNGEYEHFYDLLMSIGEQLNEAEEI